jgi:hypothetical protein
MTMRTFIGPANTNKVGVIVEIPDIDTFRPAVKSEEPTAAMKFARFVPKRW